MLQVADTPVKDKEFTFPKAGLRRNAIQQIIRKHMDERRQKESEQLELTGALSSACGSNTSGEVMSQAIHVEKTVQTVMKQGQSN